MFDTDGPVAEEIAGLWWFLLVVGTVMFVVFCAALVIALRRGRTGEGSRPAPTARSLRRWVVGWGAVAPAVVLVGVLVVTVVSMRALPAEAPPGALRVEVVGHQWWYEIRYPEEGVVTANELHLPVGRPIELELSSDDVIHSFWVPGLAGKLDMLPDRTNTLVLQADELGEHRTQCAEFCGLQHARMRLLTIVETDEDFEAWLDANGERAGEVSTPAARRGREVFGDAGCASCHTVQGTDFAGADGPDLTHLASRATIGAVTLERTRSNLRGWIADPHTFKDGVLMPATELSGEEMDALLAYLETLR
ncbi:MAG: cytochrome c oxidase subunit II [Acidimicrobiia bacterium]